MQSPKRIGFCKSSDIQIFFSKKNSNNKETKTSIRQPNKFNIKNIRSNLKYIKRLSKNLYIELFFIRIAIARISTTLVVATAGNGNVIVGSNIVV